jgi:ATP-dependent DNA helicase RecG
MIDLDAPLYPVLTKTTAAALHEQLGVSTVGDLVYHLPRRYEDRHQQSDLGLLQEGEPATILAQVWSSNLRPMKNRPGWLLEVVVGDGATGTISLTFFAQKKHKLQWRQEKQFQKGTWGLFTGVVGRYRTTVQLTHPECEMFDVEDAEGAADAAMEWAGPLIPIYPATKALSSLSIARCVRTILGVLAPPPDPLPDVVRASRGLMDLDQALHEVHRPTSRQALNAALRRLKFDEAFQVQVALVQRKHRAAQWPATPRPRREAGLLDAFETSLPYTLTEGQLAVGREISADLAAPHPMHRLLQGEVGSGKTVCAVRAMLQVVDAGGQAALLAPTEVLAAQHYRNILDLLGSHGRAGELDGAELATRVALVTGSQSAPARRRALEEAASGGAGIVIGTHALLYEGVDFADLGLVVVDEQHRFGVEQRDALRAKAAQPPHVLVMTATPIPRTVAMTVFGDLEISTLTELPGGRSPIATHVVPAAEKPHYLERAWRRLREEVEKGHQGYVVCPRIGDGAAAEDASDVDAPTLDGAPARRPPISVLEVAPLLRDGELAGLRVAELHGRLPADEKDAVMRAFSAGRLDVVVATTVVEVGVDVPNATVMMVLDADRFGVSQLHQLRGRVGRGSAPGLCLLVSEAPPAAPARERLDAVASTLDGFRLAELDLELRREGDVLGDLQSGRRRTLKLLQVRKDAEVIRDARAEAITLVEADPELATHPALASAVAALVTEERGEFLEKG